MMSFAYSLFVHSCTCSVFSIPSLRTLSSFVEVGLRLLLDAGGERDGDGSESEDVRPGGDDRDVFDGDDPYPICVIPTLGCSFFCRGFVHFTSVHFSLVQFKTSRCIRFQVTD